MFTILAKWAMQYPSYVWTCKKSIKLTTNTEHFKQMVLIGIVCVCVCVCVCLWKKREWILFEKKNPLNELIILTFFTLPLFRNRQCTENEQCWEWKKEKNTFISRIGMSIEHWRYGLLFSVEIKTECCSKLCLFPSIQCVWCSLRLNDFELHSDWKSLAAYAFAARRAQSTTERDRRRRKEKEGEREKENDKCFQMHAKS